MRFRISLNMLISVLNTTGRIMEMILNQRVKVLAGQYRVGVVVGTVYEAQ